MGVITKKSLPYASLSEFIPIGILDIKKDDSSVKINTEPDNLLHRVLNGKNDKKTIAVLLSL